jgi:hypothetical protein
MGMVAKIKIRLEDISWFEEISSEEDIVYTDFKCYKVLDIFGT